MEKVAYDILSSKRVGHIATSSENTLNKFLFIIFLAIE